MESAYEKSDLGGTEHRKNRARPRVAWHEKKRPAGDPGHRVALVDRDPAFGTDRLTSALIDFGGGRRLDFTVSTQIATHQRVQLCGSNGRIEICIPVNAPQGAQTRILVDDCSSLEGTGIATETLPESDQYQLQGEAFSRAVRGEITLPYGIEDAIANMRVIDALFRSEQSGHWEAIARD